ncbi:MAG: hypothetical protein SPL13_00980 [Clostridia bacterium]|nr:hypothetical protein [Clostridia bacterium]
MDKWKDKKGHFTNEENDGGECKHYSSQSNVAKTLADKVVKKYYSRKLDSAVMNKYSSVRNRVNKKGSATVKVNDGKNFYIIRINKSDEDFNYDIIKVWKIND